MCASSNGTHRHNPSARYECIAPRNELNNKDLSIGQKKRPHGWNAASGRCRPTLHRAILSKVSVLIPTHMVVVQVTIKRSSKRINTMQRYNTLLYLQTFYTILFTKIAIFTINTPFFAIPHLFTPPSSHLSHHFRSPTKPPRLLLPLLRHAKPPRGSSQEEIGWDRFGTK